MVEYVPACTFTSIITLQHSIALFVAGFRPQSKANVDMPEKLR